MPDIGFNATGSTIELRRSTPSRLPFGKPHVETVPIADWPAARPLPAAAAMARLFQAMEDHETAPDGAPLVLADEMSATLHPALVAQLTDGEAEALGLPPATRLALNLRSSGLIFKPGFRIDTAWTRAGGVPVRATVSGDRLRHEARGWRIPEPLFSALAHVAAINAAPDEPARHAGLAALKQAIGADAAARIASDGIIDRLRLSYASGFSLALRTTADGFDFDPVLFGRERLAAAEDGATLDETGDGLPLDAPAAIQVAGGGPPRPRSAGRHPIRTYSPMGSGAGDRRRDGHQVRVPRERHGTIVSCSAGARAGIPKIASSAAVIATAWRPAWERRRANRSIMVPRRNIVDGRSTSTDTNRSAPVPTMSPTAGDAHRPGLTLTGPNTGQQDNQDRSDARWCRLQDSNL